MTLNFSSLRFSTDLDGSKDPCLTAFELHNTVKNDTEFRGQNESLKYSSSWSHKTRTVPDK